MNKNNRRKKFIRKKRGKDTRRDGDEERRNGDGWKKTELEGWKIMRTLAASLAE